MRLEEYCASPRLFEMLERTNWLHTYYWIIHFYSKNEDCIIEMGRLSEEFDTVNDAIKSRTKDKSVWKDMRRRR